MDQKETPLPPGPSRRPDQMTEEDQRKLREYQRTRRGGSKEGEDPPDSSSRRDTGEPSPRK